MERAFAASISLALLGAMVSPALRNPPVDSFPLSDYPMFSLGRPSPLLDVTQALGVAADGTRRPLPPLVSAANREVLQSMMTIRQAVAGAPGAAPHCRQVAARVAEDPVHRDVVAVELATSRFDTVRYLRDGETAPLHRQVHHRCPVERPEGAP